MMSNKVKSRNLKNSFLWVSRNIISSSTPIKDDEVINLENMFNKEQSNKISKEVIRKVRSSFNYLL